MFSDDLKAYYLDQICLMPEYKMCLKRCHHPNIDSIVLHKRKDGSLLRVFVATGPVEFGEVAIHSHRFPADFFVLSGALTNYNVRILKNGPGEILHEWDYHSPLLGGEGLTYVHPVVAVWDYWDYPQYDSFQMSEWDVHTVSCEAGTSWIVSEGPEKKKTSRSYTKTAEPFTVEGLYEPMSVEEVNEAVDKIYEAMVG